MLWTRNLNPKKDIEMLMNDPRHITQVFDCTNVNHIKAHEHLEQNKGQWPADLPAELANADYEGPWQVVLKIKVLEHYKSALDSMIAQAKSQQERVKQVRTTSRYSYMDNELNELDSHSSQILSDLEDYLGFVP